MAKSAAPAKRASNGGKSPVAPVRLSAPKKMKTKIGSLALKGTRIDPRVAQALADDAPATRIMTVMVKLNPRGSAFARFAVSNVSGNERGKVFQAEVEEIAKRTAEKAGKAVRVLSSMPNVGVAKVQTQTSALRTLLEDDKIVGVQLAAS